MFQRLHVLIHTVMMQQGAVNRLSDSATFIFLQQSSFFMNFFAATVIIALMGRNVLGFEVSYMLHNCIGKRFRI